jgi:hypothetical protein
MGFQNFQILGYDFTKNCQFISKTKQNSVFLIRDPNIPDRLYIMVMYFSFYRFSKFSNFHSKFVGVGLQFYRKSTV